MRTGSGYSAPSDRGPRNNRADRALAVEELRRGGEEACAVGFVPSDRILVLPVDRDGIGQECFLTASAALR